MRLFKVFGFGLVVVFLGLASDCFPTAAVVPALENEEDIDEGIENEESDILSITPTTSESDEEENKPENIPTLWLKLTGTEITAKENIASFSAFNYQITALISGGAEGDASAENENANEDIEEESDELAFIQQLLCQMQLPITDANETGSH